MINIFKKEIKNRFLGIDLNPNYVSIVEFYKDKKGNLILDNYISKDIIGGWMTEEIVKEEEQLGQFILNILDKERFIAKKCAISLPTHTVMRKTFEVDKKLKDREIEDLIIHSGKKYIVQNIEEVYFDFKVINEESPINNENKEVLLVASKKKNLTTREDALVIAGLEPVVVDIEQYAVERGFFMIEEQIKNELHIDLENKEKPVVALIEVMDLKLKLDLYINNKFSYSIEESFEDMGIKSISSQKNGLKLKNTNFNLNAENDENDEKNNKEEDYSNFNEEQIKYLNLIKKILNKVNYSFLASEYLNGIDVIILKGKNNKLEELIPYITKNNNTPVLNINPTNSFYLSDKINKQDLEKNASSLFLACCLGMRGIYK